MKAYKSILTGLALLALVLAVPVWAEMISVSDSDMAGIAGKLNTLTVTGGGTTQVASSDASANIQVGWFQWSDLHDTDKSNQKGANFFPSGQLGGATSTAINRVQENVTAAVNAISWGATGNGEFTASSMSGVTSFVNMNYAVMAVGGF